ncbi:MAG: hypothetical protein AVO35_08705 [Candidatus Aegiribacteria sp. MLS_C]|nr:MAG: hypothetical protein AVO35_08705 [Candidatus Aegiribacteria sp. MLS_C]
MKTRKPEDLIRPERLRQERLLYHHSPRRSLLISGVIIAVMVAAGLFLFRDVPMLRFIMGLFSLGLLINLRRECSVRIWVNWPYIVYEYHSIFRHFREYIEPWRISGLNPDIVSMWRGNISERLVMEVGDRELVVSPFYSGYDPGENLIVETLRSLPGSRQQAEEKLAEEHRIDHPEEHPEEEPEVVEVWGFLEMGIQCPRCEGPVAVNGPYTALVCPHCSAGIDMQPSIWADLLEDVPQEIAEDCEEGYGGKSTIWGTYNTELFYGRMKPYCEECKRDYDLENDPVKDGRITCPDCGSTRSLQVPPEWWKSIFSDASMIIGAGESSDESNLEGDPLKGPVVFTCTKCGAAVKLDGSSRDLKCEHCDGEIHIPDDLWLRFHPAVKKKRWFVGYRWVPDTEEDDE